MNKNHDFDEFDVTLANGQIVRMIRSCLFHCYLNNTNKSIVINYKHVMSAI